MQRILRILYSFVNFIEYQIVSELCFLEQKICNDAVYGFQCFDSRFIVLIIVFSSTSLYLCNVTDRVTIPCELVSKDSAADETVQLGMKELLSLGARSVQFSVYK